MTHSNSVFTNSCLRVPVDPLSKMPKSAYERSNGRVSKQSSIDSTYNCSVPATDLDAEKLKDFYRSIPDYNDINHLPTEEFYSTLKSLREKKKIMLGYATEHINDCNASQILEKVCVSEDCKSSIRNKNTSFIPRRKFSMDGRDTDNERINNHSYKNSNTNKPCPINKFGTCLKNSSRKTVVSEEIVKSNIDDLKVTPIKQKPDKLKTERPKRNHSACSISWNDAKFECKNEVDEKFEQYFGEKKYTTISRRNDDAHEFKTQSMPSSPLRLKQGGSLFRRRRSITIPKPFKMTERDEEERIVNELRSLRKSFSEDMLNQKCERKKFRSKPVPIESRIPLYDKILEDQAMRRAITKINSEADLRAQMKPFSFTKREEKGLGICEKAGTLLPKSKKKKRFKARPVPKNLFSNYFYDKMNEDEFFRSMNKRIRAEEMLRGAHYPGNMATRDRSHLSTPGAHSDLPIDPSPAIPSAASSDRQRCASPVKDRKKRNKYSKEDFITTSPQPFRFNTADRAAKKMEDVVKKLYQDSKSTESIGCGGEGVGGRAYSAIELRSNTTGRSNLAALLRVESVRRRFEMDADRPLAEQRRKLEMRHRDRLLRSKPAWHLVENNHEEDIAMRLQTRRDEERMRREEFLHEMELMYGRVKQQPMLFERFYAPRSYSTPIDGIRISPRKVSKKQNKNMSHLFNSPNRSRKVSINTAEAYSGDFVEYLNRIKIDDKYSDSEGIDSLDRR